MSHSGKLIEPEEGVVGTSDLQPVCQKYPRSRLPTGIWSRGQSCRTKPWTSGVCTTLELWVSKLNYLAEHSVRVHRALENTLVWKSHTRGKQELMPLVSTVLTLFLQVLLLHSSKTPKARELRERRNQDDSSSQLMFWLDVRSQFFISWHCLF